MLIENDIQGFDINENLYIGDAIDGYDVREKVFMYIQRAQEMQSLGELIIEDITEEQIDSLIAETNPIAKENIKQIFKNWLALKKKEAVAMLNEVTTPKNVAIQLSRVTYVGSQICKNLVLKEAAGTSIKQALFNSTLKKIVDQGGKSVLVSKSAVECGQTALCKSITSKSTWAASAAILVIETGYLYYNWHVGKIDGKVFWKQVGIKLMTNVVSTAAGSIGMGLGALIGTCLCPGVGTQLALLFFHLYLEDQLRIKQKKTYKINIVRRLKRLINCQTQTLCILKVWKNLMQMRRLQWQVFKKRGGIWLLSIILISINWKRKKIAIELNLYKS